MFEELVLEKIVLELEGTNSKLTFGILINEDSDSIKLKLNDGTILTINKSKIISARRWKDE